MRDLLGSQLRHELLVKLLQLVHRRLLCWPTDDEALGVGWTGLGDDMKVDVVDLLVGDPAVVL